MQHLLTSDELAELQEKGNRVRVAEERLAAAIVAGQHMARMLVPEGKCIHDKREHGDGAPLYCDDCPLSAKTFNASVIDNTQPDLVRMNSMAFSNIDQFMCTRSKEYSK